MNQTNTVVYLLISEICPGFERAALERITLLSLSTDHNFPRNAAPHFLFHYWHACSNNNRLYNWARPRRSDRFGEKNCLRCQHRADYYTGFKTFWQRLLKSWQPVKRDCSTNSFLLLNLWLTGTFLAVFPLWFKAVILQKLFHLSWKWGWIKSFCGQQWLLSSEGTST